MDGFGGLSKINDDEVNENEHYDIDKGLATRQSLQNMTNSRNNILGVNKTQVHENGVKITTYLNNTQGNVNLNPSQS